ncbi:MAG: hypothetical protein CMJ42_20860 [Phyllobacteriaceae bacterium]|nr:hypothetical protein [Phyllobacteriaceae bacterium]MBA90786.1 hypothetical protein [Phyllobacteriaceae bacterium]
MSDSDLPHLNPFEVRVLGCLMEKQLLTPDVYPLTLNALQSAANQKSSREPVMAMEPVEINRALKSLEDKGLARRVFGSRAERFEHLAARTFRLTAPQSALLALLLLRGPQTLNELLTRTERMAHFASAEAVREELDMLIGQRPPLVKEIGRAPGQREDRFAHLLAGDIDISDLPARPAPRPAASTAISELEERVRQLEEEVAALKARLEAAGA